MTKIPINSRKEEKHCLRHYKKTVSVIKSFDRHYDNTVVDTYAFDKVLRSEELANLIMSNLPDKSQEQNSTLMDIHNLIYDHIIGEVTKIYQKNHHRIVDHSVYHCYIDHLMSKILLEKN